MKKIILLFSWQYNVWLIYLKISSCKDGNKWIMKILLGRLHWLTTKRKGINRGRGRKMKCVEKCLEKKPNLLISFLYIFVVLQSSLSSSQFCPYRLSCLLHWRCCWYALKCNLYYWFNLVNWFLLSSQLAFYLSYTISCFAIEPHSSL